MNKIWKYFICLAITLFITETLLVILLQVTYRSGHLWATIVVFAINCLFFFVFFLLFLLITRKKTLRTQQVLTYVNKTAFNFSGLGICIYDKNKEIIWVNDLIEERESKSIIGMSVITWIPSITLLIENQNLKLKINKNNRIYEIRLLKESSAILLHDITDYEALIKNHLDESMVIGTLFIDNFKNLISTNDERFQIKLISIINEEIANWSQKYNAFIKSYDKDSYMFMMKNIDYQKVISENKFDFIKSIQQKTHEIGAPISISIGVGYGISDPSLLYSVASENLSRAIQKGGNKVIAQSYYQTNRDSYGWDLQNIEKSTSVETKIFGLKVKEKILNATNVLISGHKWGDFDSIASGLAMYYLAKFFGKDARIVIDFNLIDNNAKVNLMKILPKDEQEKIYINPKQAYRYFKNNSLLIAVDTHIKGRIEVPELVTMAQNIVVVDHHLLSDTNIILTEDSYIQSKASSTSEIVSEILSEFLTQKDLPIWSINLLFTGMLLDTNNFKVRTTQRTFEVAALLKSWGADPTVAQSLLKDDLKHILLKQSITNHAFELAPGFICASAPNKIKLPRSLIAQVAQDLSEIKDVKAAFAFAYDDGGIASMSARSNGIINVEKIAEAMGGGGHYNAAAAQNSSLSLDKFFEKFKIVFKETIKSEKEQEKIFKNNNKKSIKLK